MQSENCPNAALLDKKFVRVRNIRADGLVEFDFAISAPEIFVELIMPEIAFRDFCTTNNVTDVTGEPLEEVDFDARLSRVLAGEPAQGSE